MHCPFCRHGDTKVIDSRGTQEESIRRRRECLQCQRRFTTYERIEEAPLRVVKRDGRVVPFDRKLVRAGLEKAVYKRPVSEQQVDALIEQLEKEIYDSYERTIPSVEIGQLVMDELRDLDQVAYVRFASVYSNFNDVSDFAEVAGSIQRTDRPSEASALHESSPHHKGVGESTRGDSRQPV